ncbi:hypothetical protein BRADI_1g24143v3 [Brachypodium distachyon]|uniref:Uncharacterized protein n=1 Tax=Brachypodium distachyon TaxID=15368 RepID=A0A0Q3GXB0_BRADI|nr:hypothetical protein BRADI_1g24143v3 [Brachypodium distachyon]
MGVVSSTVPAALLLTSFLLISKLPRCRPLSFSYNFSDSATYDRADITTEGAATYSPTVAAGYSGKRNPAAAGSPAPGDSSSAGASSSSFTTGGARSTATSSSTTVGPSSCCPESSVVSMQQTAGM